MGVDSGRVALRVKSLRADKGWRQADLAREAGVSVQTIARIERACGCMGLDVAGRLADAFGCTIDEVACRKA